MLRGSRGFAKMQDDRTTMALPLPRRTLLQLLGGSAPVALFSARSSAANLRAVASVTTGGNALSIDFDGALRSRISRDGAALTRFDAGEALLLGKGKAVDRFVLVDHRQAPVNDAQGHGVRHTLGGLASAGIEKIVQLTYYDRHPGFAIMRTEFVNRGAVPLAVTGWRAAAHALLPVAGGAWSYSGASYANRRDWIQPVKPGFDQRNFMGMNASDYGGGTPVVDVWNRRAGLAVGHVEVTPKLIALPIRDDAGATAIAIEGETALTLAPGEHLATPDCFIAAHRGDHFAALDGYRRIMAERGLAAPAMPQTSYEPIWCAWGYERNFTTEQIIATLPKAKSLGLEWAVLDDGWQTSEGDWKVDRTKFPHGDDDMKAFAEAVTAQGMKPRLWYAPLAVDPGTDLLHDHSDMLLLDKNGAVQNVTWWNAFTLCPAYPPTVEYFKKQVARFIGDWGYKGLKLDGQHLNGVAPCYNPKHNHARPEESVEKLQDFWKALYDTAIAIDPETVVEICPCGTAFAFHNIPYMNQTPASDPESSWQVRLKGKTMKALMGPSAPFAGDHVELSDHGDDFASTFGIGGILSTKFTWPHDTTNPSGDILPPGGYVLTPAKETLWRKWIALYRDRMLPTGRYLGGLYDIGFDKPETHVVAKDGVMHYAFYAERWSGPLELRGLGPGSFALKDGFTGRPLGVVTAASPRIPATFERFMLVEATPA
jgi:alpha-galactosidase